MWYINTCACVFERASERERERARERDRCSEPSSNPWQAVCMIFQIF